MVWYDKQLVLIRCSIDEKSNELRVSFPADSGLKGFAVGLRTELEEMGSWQRRVSPSSPLLTNRMLTRVPSFSSISNSVGSLLVLCTAIPSPPLSFLPLFTLPQCHLQNRSLGSWGSTSSWSRSRLSSRTSACARPRPVTAKRQSGRNRHRWTRQGARWSRVLRMGIRC